MKLTSLHKLLHYEMTVSVFISEIGKELTEYSSKKLIIGASQPIKVSDEFPWYLTEDEMVSLLQLFMDDQISPIVLEYICDCLELTEDVQYSTTISDALCSLSNPEINGTNTKEKAIQILNTLKGESKEPRP